MDVVTYAALNKRIGQAGNTAADTNVFIAHVKCDPAYRVPVEDPYYYICDPDRMTTDAWKAVEAEGKKIVLQVETTAPDGSTVIVTATEVKTGGTASFVPVFSADVNGVKYEFRKFARKNPDAPEEPGRVAIFCVPPLAYLTADKAVPYLSAGATDDQLPTAKAVVDYVAQNGSGGTSGIRYGFDANTGTLYLYGDGEFYGNGETNHENIKEQVKHVVFFENISSVHDYAFRNDYPNLETVSFCNSVTSIGHGAFTTCTNLRRVQLPKNITELGNLTRGLIFANTGIEEITIPAAVTILGRTSFTECANLKKFEFEKNSELLTIHKSAISDCPMLKKIDLPKKVTEIRENAFAHDTALKQITLPASLTSIGANCFNDCTALEFVMYDGTAEQWAAIENDESNNVFLNADNLYMIVPNDVPDAIILANGVAIGNALGKNVQAAACEFRMTESNNMCLNFHVPENGSTDAYYCISLFYPIALFPGSTVKAVKIEEGIKAIINSGVHTASGSANGGGAFQNCAMEEISLPESMERIDDYTFVGCNNLKRIYVPAGVSYIGKHAFYCANGAPFDIYYGGSEQDWEKFDFTYEKFPNQDKCTVHYNATGLPE